MSYGEKLPASWGSDETAPGRRRWLWVAGAVAVVLVAIGAVIAVQAIKDEQEKAWPAVLSVRPGGLGGQEVAAADVTPEEKPGVYLWNDFQGWHLWVVNGDGVGPVKGTLTSDKSFDDAELAVPEAGTLERDGGRISFSLPEDPAVVGVDFGPGFYAERLRLELDGDLPVYRGDGKERADTPLVIEKLDADDPAASRS